MGEKFSAQTSQSAEVAFLSGFGGFQQKLYHRLDRFFDFVNKCVKPCLLRKFQNGRLMLSLQENEFKKNPKISKILKTQKIS